MDSIVTSYFANWRKLQKDGYTIVSVAHLSIPNTLRIQELAPSYDIVRGHKAGYVSDEIFKDEYLYQLDHVDFTVILPRLHGKVALCCYEKPGDFCHRHILAEYLNNKFNLSIQEYK